jgi:multidrug efflux pump subunit AcrA (membrane-fusion protein)
LAAAQAVSPTGRQPIATGGDAALDESPAPRGAGQQRLWSLEHPMNDSLRSLSALAVLLVATGAAPACRGRQAGAARAADTDAVVAVAVAPVVQQQVTRTLRLTGSLIAEEEAEVAAETGGRVVATPVERGAGVREGDALLRIAATEADASAREAEANVAQRSKPASH